MTAGCRGCGPRWTRTTYVRVTETAERCADKPGKRGRNKCYGRVPAGSTSRLIVLTCAWLWALQDRRNVQQPGFGKSAPPPALVKVRIGCDSPNGRASIATLMYPVGYSAFATQWTLLLVPSTRGLLPA